MPSLGGKGAGTGVGGLRMLEMEEDWWVGAARKMEEGGYWAGVGTSDSTLQSFRYW